MKQLALPLPPLLELTASQLEVALQSSCAQVERLASSVAAFARLGCELRAHPDAAVAAHGERLAAEAQRAMFAMQYHDQLSQRVQHVRDALGDIHDAMSAPQAPASTALLAAIRARYTMEDERRLFDTILGPVDGVANADAGGDRDALRSTVELF